MDSSTSPHLSTPTAGAAEAKENVPLRYYGICGLAGALSCGLVHTLAHPHTNVACSMQIDPAKYASAYCTTKGSISHVFGRSIRYSMQGLVALPLFELWGGRQLNSDGSITHKEGMGWCSQAAVAALACNGRVLFTNVPKALTGRAAVMYQDLIDGCKLVMQKNGCRLLMYSFVQLPLFELAVSATYRHIKPKADCKRNERFAINLAAGFVAGIACAIVSHPAEQLVYKELDHLGLVKGAKQLGYRGLWAGIVPRCGMMGTVAALQWIMYQGCKNHLSFHASIHTPPIMPESLREKLEEAKIAKLLIV